MENSPPIRKEPPLKRLNLRNWKKNRPEFWRRPFFFFFGDHLILGGKNLWISETFRLKFRTNRLKLIQGQWKFESRSFAHFSLFQNSPPFPNPGYAPARELCIWLLGVRIPSLVNFLKTYEWFGTWHMVFNFHGLLISENIQPFVASKFCIKKGQRSQCIEYLVKAAIKYKFRTEKITEIWNASDNLSEAKRCTKSNPWFSAVFHRSVQEVCGSISASLRS